MGTDYSKRIGTLLPSSSTASEYGDGTYIIDKINNANFIDEPFPHLEIKDFLPPDVFTAIVNDDQIHFSAVNDTNTLYNKLIENGWRIQQFPGCSTSWNEYIQYIQRKLHDKSYSGGDTGITFRLKSYNNPVIQKLLHFMNSYEFYTTLINKFKISRSADMVSAIQKNLTGYEISPHPDIRQKALTYLLNINKDNDDIDAQNCHTHLLEFKPEYKHIEDGWAKNTNAERPWVPWEKCNIRKTINTNNTMVMFMPNSKPASLHAIKLDYNHLEYQRTQIYGNLIYKQETNSQALSEINVL